MKQETFKKATVICNKIESAESIIKMITTSLELNHVISLKCDVREFKLSGELRKEVTDLIIDKISKDKEKLEKELEEL